MKSYDDFDKRFARKRRSINRMGLSINIFTFVMFSISIMLSIGVAILVCYLLVNPEAIGEFLGSIMMGFENKTQ
jgi:hypothetical protein